MNYRQFKRIVLKILSAFLCISILSSSAINICAAPGDLEDFLAQAEARKALPVQTNEIENWPDGPAISAETAILMDAYTGVILYAKNIDKKMYPASTTKLMTSLIAAENSNINDVVTFSHDAVFSIERGSSNIGIDEGQSMPMEECLYGILVASANEVANAAAEHVAGSLDAFMEMMNKKAVELGCKNTNFVNAHGLYDDNHYTSAYDLALIAKAFFENELLAKIGNTSRYHFEATATQPDDFIERNKHKLITGDISCEGVKGGKTGYTDEARQTLVTCAEKNGMKLICIVMKEESPDQFYDTVKLFDYGFTNFNTVNVSENETKYSVKSPEFFQTAQDVFGNSKPILSLNESNYLLLPKTVRFEDLESDISYDTNASEEIALINYYYHNSYVGNATINLAAQDHKVYSFDSQAAEEETLTSDAEGKTIFVNIKVLLIIILIIAALLIGIFVLHSVISNYAFLDSDRRRRRRRKSRRNNHRLSSKFKDFNP